MGLIKDVKSRVAYVSDSPSNIASFLGEYLEEAGLVTKFDRGMQQELEGLIMKKFGNMPEDLTEAVEVVATLATTTVVGLGFTAQKWAVGLIPWVGPTIVAVEEILQIPELARSFAKKLIALLFDLEEDIVDAIVPEDKDGIMSKLFERIRGKREGGKREGIIKSIMEKIKDRVGKIGDRDSNGDNPMSGLLENLVDRVHGGGNSPSRDIKRRII